MTTAIHIDSLGDITRAHAELRGNQPALIFEGKETSFAALDRRANQVANGLIGAGLKPQTRVALLDKNSDRFFEVLFGAAKANDVMVAVNWRLAPPEVAYVVNDAMAEVLFVSKEFFPVVETIRAAWIASGL